MLTIIYWGLWWGTSFPKVLLLVSLYVIKNSSFAIVEETFCDDNHLILSNNIWLMFIKREIVSLSLCLDAYSNDFFFLIKSLPKKLLQIWVFFSLCNSWSRSLSTTLDDRNLYEILSCWNFLDPNEAIFTGDSKIC